MLWHFLHAAAYDLVQRQLAADRAWHALTDWEAGGYPVRPCGLDWRAGGYP